MLYNIFLSGDDVIMKKRILNITFAALFTAITAALSQAAIPTPFGVPLTLQTFAVALCGYVLGIKWGLASIITYILLGMFGVPVFSGFKGGAQVLFGATGGFIFGFLFLAAFCGAAEIIKNKYLKILPGFAGLAVCHLLGTVQYALIYKMEFIPAFLLVSAPYLLKDAISVVLAFLPAVYIKRLLLKMHIG